MLALNRTFLFPLMFLLSTTAFWSFAQGFPDSEAFRSLDADQQRAIELILEHEEVLSFLADYPDWRAETYADSETEWHVDFYVADEWIAYAHIDIENRKLFETKFPRKLSDEEYVQRRAQIETLLFNDAEVMALLIDPAWWDYEVDYDPYEETWWASFWKGIDAVTVDLRRDDEQFVIERVYDPEVFDEEKAQRLARDQAVELAWQAEGVGEALEGWDDWRSYAEVQEGSKWTVSFATTEDTLFTALVDIEAWEVLETFTP